MPWPAILAAVSALGPILGKASQGRADAQATNEALGIQRANADINRRRYMLEAPGERSRSAARASMVQNFTPTTIKLGTPGFGERGETPAFEGGFNNEGMYSPDARKVASNAVRDHLVAQMTGADKVPELPEVGRSSKLDKILGMAGFGTGILGGIMGSRASRYPSRAGGVNTSSLDL